MSSSNNAVAPPGAKHLEEYLEGLGAKGSSGDAKVAAGMDALREMLDIVQQAIQKLMPMGRDTDALAEKVAAMPADVAASVLGAAHKATCYLAAGIYMTRGLEDDVLPGHIAQFLFMLFFLAGEIAERHPTSPALAALDVPEEALAGLQSLSIIFKGHEEARKASPVSEEVLKGYIAHGSTVLEQLKTFNAAEVTAYMQSVHPEATHARLMYGVAVFSTKLLDIMRQACLPLPQTRDFLQHHLSLMTAEQMAACPELPTVHMRSVALAGYHDDLQGMKRHFDGAIAAAEALDSQSHVAMASYQQAVHLMTRFGTWTLKEVEPYASKGDAAYEICKQYISRKQLPFLNYQRAMVRLTMERHKSADSDKAIPAIVESEFAAIRPGPSEQEMAQSMMDNTPRCQNCQEVLAKPKTCSACKGVAYCGETCQKKHWPAHKAECKRRRQQQAAGA